MAEGHLGGDREREPDLHSEPPLPPSSRKTQFLWAALSRVHQQSGVWSHPSQASRPPEISPRDEGWGRAHSHLPPVSGQAWLWASSGTLPSLQESTSQKNLDLGLLATSFPSTAEFIVN